MQRLPWRLILNGKSAQDEGLREAVAAMRARGVPLEVRVTWEQGDVARLVDEAIAGGVGTLIAGGGDGTLSAVAAAMAGREEAARDLPRLGLIPLGTANDFAVAAGIPDSAQAALELIADGTAPAVDLLRVETGQGVYWCANLASGGFGTQVTVETDEGLKKMLGGLAYLITGIAKLGRIEPLAARLHGPDFEWEGALIALGVGNGRQAGGGQVLCPGALIDDGLLEVTILPELSGEVVATMGTLVTGGKGAALERVAVRTQLPWLELEFEAPQTLNLDGEPVQSRQFRVQCVSRRVRLCLPADSPLLG